MFLHVNNKFHCRRQSGMNFGYVTEIHLRKLLYLSDFTYVLKKFIPFFHFCAIMFHHKNIRYIKWGKTGEEKNLVPLIVFLLGMCLVGCIVYKTDTHEKWQRRTTAQLNVSTYGERIKNEITNGIAITDALKQVLISENGEINQFDTIAENLISDSIESVQLAPDGVVTDIYPACSWYFFRFNPCTFTFERLTDPIFLSSITEES